MEYIDTQMAKRYQRSPLPETQEASRSSLQQPAGGQSIPGQQLEREPASLGKLHEIDLGQETKLQNIARTEAATRRLVGDEVVPDLKGDLSAPTSRPATDQKPWRQRKRRTSADTERDRLVEEVLRESKGRWIRAPDALCDDGAIDDDEGDANVDVFHSGCLRRTGGRAAS